MSAAAPKRILVVDDEKDVAEALQYTIEDDGYEVVTATDEQEALAKIAEGKFDAAVLDVKMGRIGGLGIARRLRAASATSRIPIVLVSGLDEPSVRKRFADYDLFVSKGADVGDLGKQLASLIKLTKRRG